MDRLAGSVVVGGHKFDLRTRHYADDREGNRYLVITVGQWMTLVESVATKERYWAPTTELTRVVLEGERV